MAEKVFTDANFDTDVLKSDLPVVVDFWAPWCGPCRMIGPFIEELSKEYENRVLVGKLNVDDNPEVSMKYNVRSIPTVLFFKNGELVDRQVGATSKKALASKIEALI